MFVVDFNPDAVDIQINALDQRRFVRIFTN